MRLIKTACAMALVMGLVSAAYAETQNVKISGDLTFRSISRWDYDLRTKDSGAALGSGVGSSNYFDDNHYFLQTTEIQVDADLTDNVSTVVRLANEQVWGEEEDTSAHSYDVGVVKAYVTLKEMLYSPLTLKVGRQDLWFGRGFIVGSNTARWNAERHIPAGTHASAAEEYSVFDTFDAIRATLDYDPWTIDLVYSKVGENTIDKNDDIDLYVANAGYVFDSYQGEAEVYYVGKIDRSGPNTLIDRTNDIHTIGARGSFDPLENLTFAGEVAGQLGSYVAVTAQSVNRDRNAWALDISAEYRMPDINWTPWVGLEYVFYSGNEVGNDTGDYDGWDPVYRGKFDTLIREFKAVPYGTAHSTRAGIYGATAGGGLNTSATFGTNQDDASTNQHQILVRGGLKPTDSLTAGVTYAHFWLDEDISLTRDKEDIGDEIDVSLVYDYTEDVQFGLLIGWFFPGDLYPTPEDEMATDVVASVHVSF